MCGMKGGDADDGGKRPLDENDPFGASLRTSLRGETLMVADPAFGWARLSRAIDRNAGARTRRRPWTWQAAAAVLFAVALGQGAWIATSSPDRFDLAANDGAVALQVAFRPDASEAELRALLSQIGAEIVAGPSALGLYDIAVADPASAQEVLAATPIVEGVSAP